MNDDRFLLICKDDNGVYQLATRKLFTDHQEVIDRYAGIDVSRKAIIVRCSKNTVMLRKEDL